MKRSRTAVIASPSDSEWSVAGRTRNYLDRFWTGVVIWAFGPCAHAAATSVHFHSRIASPSMLASIHCVAGQCVFADGPLQGRNENTWPGSTGILRPPGALLCSIHPIPHAFVNFRSLGPAEAPQQARTVLPTLPTSDIRCRWL